MSTLTRGTERRIERILERAGLRSAYAALKTDAWCATSPDGDKLYVLSDAEDPDHTPDPRDVLLCTYVKDSDGEWCEGYEEWPTTLRDALAWIAERTTTTEGPNR